MRWLKIDRVAAIHQLQLAEHGGGSGIRDIGLLESALARPENIAAYEPDADVATLAAAYAFGIIKNHPFIDGNKRTGYVVMETFLVINGYQLTATPQDKYITFLNLAEGTFTEDDLAGWLRDRLAAG
ncbi:MAG: type II toxin-antitoxin system death-on-curing family toxin [Pyrinomonadaceae bacterium]|nr:type II toxin-antitoxin system death-on-curing family toxin [Pyrinomonadaceae bacterium]MBP6212323.1 type II toxin-antitoxin system death-on-curing family toxin [Pyrinomonadaceae bacterium]